MTGAACPYCGRRTPTDRKPLETRTVGVTNDWETWRRVTCQGCCREFIYRVD